MEFVTGAEYAGTGLDLGGGDSGFDPIASSGSYINVRIDPGRDGIYEQTGRLYSDGFLVSDRGWGTYRWDLGSYVDDSVREAHLRRANGDGQDGGLVEYDSGGGGGTPEQQAFNFASSIVDFMELDPFNPDHVKWREMVTSTLERIYMLAHTDPGKFINGPFQNDLTAQQLYDMVSSKRFSVQLSGLAFGVGANYDLANKISYDIDHSDLVGYRNIWGDRGMNYVILHEIAHIDTRGHQGNVEGNANTLALGIAEALGISFLTAGELSTVGGGVVSQN